MEHANWCGLCNCIASGGTIKSALIEGCVFLLSTS
uniref:Uncharacterized protein n=1 Tax=Triticum urartu TaxID=4572 RepID=A0A8R7Q510_TRIUA